MAVSTYVYNHTTQLFASGAINSTDSFKVKLLSAATFNAANTTMAQAATGYTEVANGLGGSDYVTGGKALTNVTVTTTTTNDAFFDADDVVWTAGAGADLVARYALLYDDTNANDAPLLFIDFGEEEAAGITTQFKIVWNASGIFSFTTA
jgi:L-2-hydroxyglutarate oxidase LhgO